MLVVKANNTATIDCVVKTAAGTIQNITSWSFRFIVRNPNGDVVFQKSSTVPSEILITDATNGKVSVFIVPADTVNHSGNFKYELQGIDGAGEQFTLNGPADMQITNSLFTT